MKLKTTIKLLVFVILILSFGLYSYQNWKSETLWGVFFVVVFVGVPAWVILTMKLWMRCSRCRKFGVVTIIGAELRRKGDDLKPSPDDVDSDEDISSLDLSMDLYDLAFRYKCDNCGFEWGYKRQVG